VAGERPERLAPWPAAMELVGARRTRLREPRNDAREVRGERGGEGDAHHGENGDNGGSNRRGDARPVTAVYCACARKKGVRGKEMGKGESGSSARGSNGRGAGQGERGSGGGDLWPVVPAAEKGEREGAVGEDETDQRAPLVGEREREGGGVAGWARPKVRKGGGRGGLGRAGQK